MSDFGIVTEAGSVRFERVLPGPLDRVWRYLTDSDLRGRWLAFGAMEARMGAPFRLEFHNTRLGPGDMAVPDKYKDVAADGCATTGSIQAWEPGRLLSFTWDEAGGDPSLVTIELAPEGDGPEGDGPEGDGKVRLILTHRRVNSRAVMISVSAGWHTHLGILSAELEGAAAPGFWTLHTALEQEYETRLAG
ncbi:SRPBCC family protein [Niveispirillum fermenti]|uniref:SRPBCC family protein n=1 Tax=Niveispirillum fermenti TaxID=1233113 RepID=UPI003A844B7E